MGIMMEKSNIDWYSSSDPTLLEMIGIFLREARLQQNKSQEVLAEAAGIHRSTIVRIEKGEGGTLLSFIQLLRALEKLPVLQVFEAKPQISPMQLAKLELHKRRRAGGSNDRAKQQGKSDL